MQLLYFMYSIWPGLPGQHAYHYRAPSGLLFLTKSLRRNLDAGHVNSSQNTVVLHLYCTFGKNQITVLAGGDGQVTKPAHSQRVTEQETNSDEIDWSNGLKKDGGKVSKGRV